MAENLNDPLYHAMVNDGIIRHCAPKHIILDCDDVLLDWIGGFRAFLREHFWTISVPEEGPNNWSLANWLGIPDERCLLLIETFNATKKFGQLQPMPGAVEAIAAIKAKGYAMTVLTSCSDDPAVAVRRRQNLAAVYGDTFKRVVCLGLGESKSTWLTALKTGIWIEDNYKNALAGMMAGHRTYMMRRSHNRADERQSHSAITWIDDLQSISLLT